MSAVDYANGLIRAHEIINEARNRVEREHLRTPDGFFGPTRRHHELMVVSRELRDLGHELLLEVKRLKPGDAPSGKQS